MKLGGKWLQLNRLDMKISTVYKYDGFSRECLLRFKDGNDRWLLNIFLSPYLLQFYFKFYKYTIVAVPSHISASERRGYIPTHELCRSLKLPLECDVLMKKHPYKQSTMHRSVRENIKDVIMLNDIDKIRGKHILLFDDLVTTGHTLRACYELLEPYVLSIQVFALFHHDI
ncbi:MAG: ComF family protein [Erysipelothrix sp.]|nr:ComF family protein [Erysipelothrix sp.]